MALFRRNKDKETAAAEGAAPAGDNGAADAAANGAPGSEAAIGFSPEKARKFFDYAQTMHEASNFPYAMTLWLQGLGQDPSSVKGLENFFRSAGAFLGDQQKKKPDKETVNAVSGRGEISKYLLALLEWSTNPREAKLAIKAVEIAAKFGLREPTVWLGRRAFAIAADDQRPREEHFRKLLEIFEKLGEYDLAVQAGEMATRINPADATLAARVKNLSAESTMSRGGFDSTEEGGFRKNIRNSDKQKALEEEEGVVKSDETIDRIVARAKAAWEERPEDNPSIIKYVKALIDRRKGDDEKVALDLLERTYERTREYRFREFADQIRLRQARWKAALAKKAAEQSPGDEAAQAASEAAQRQFAELRVQVGEGQVAAYPTDLSKKYELGRAYFDLERYEDAIGMFQEAQNDAKRRTEVLGYLGKAFQSIGWQDAAIDTYRKALESRPDMDDEITMDLRYGLMGALKEHAREQRDVEAADEAYKLASGIAMQNFNYRDIKEQRQEIKALLDELKAAGS